jgi:hypothetical protein
LAGAGAAGAGAAGVGAAGAGVVVFPQPLIITLLRIITEKIIKNNFFIVGSYLLSRTNVIFLISPCCLGHNATSKTLFLHY